MEFLTFDIISCWWSKNYSFQVLPVKVNLDFFVNGEFSKHLVLETKEKELHLRLEV